jgi:hypothetical protein
VELVEGHLVLEECPAELRLVIDVRDLGDLLRGRARGVGIKLLGDGRSVILEFLKERGCNSQEVNASKGLNLAALPRESITSDTR